MNKTWKNTFDEGYTNTMRDMSFKSFRAADILILKILSDGTSLRWSQTLSEPVQEKSTKLSVQLLEGRPLFELNGKLSETEKTIRLKFPNRGSATAEL